MGFRGKESMGFDRFLREAAPLEGLEWRKYRRRSARHWVEWRMEVLGLTGFDSYLDIIRADQGERGGLAGTRWVMELIAREAGSRRLGSITES